MLLGPVARSQQPASKRSLLSSLRQNWGLDPNIDQSAAQAWKLGRKKRRPLPSRLSRHNIMWFMTLWRCNSSWFFPELYQCTTWHMGNSLNACSCRPEKEGEGNTWRRTCRDNMKQMWSNKLKVPAYDPPVNTCQHLLYRVQKCRNFRSSRRKCELGLHLAPTPVPGSCKVCISHFWNESWQKTTNTMVVVYEQQPSTQLRQGCQQVYYSSAAGLTERQLTWKSQTFTAQNDHNLTWVGDFWLVKHRSGVCGRRKIHCPDLRAWRGQERRTWPCLNPGPLWSFFSLQIWDFTWFHNFSD